MNKFLEQKRDGINGDFSQNSDEYREGFDDAVALLWPCVKALKNIEEYLDTLDFRKADSKLYELTGEALKTIGEASE